MRLAVRANGAIGATRAGPAAHRGAQIHDGLGVVRHAFDRRVGFGQPPQLVEGSGRRHRPGDPVPARQHALDVRVQDRGPPAVALRDDRRRGGAADPGQPLDSLQLAGKDPAVLPHDDAGRPVQVARPRVVPQAAPQVQHLVEIGLRQARHIREPRKEPCEVGDDRAHLGLLQHDLRHPDPVRRALVLPGEVLAAVDVPPGEEAMGKTHPRQLISQVSSSAARHARRTARRSPDPDGAPSFSSAAPVPQSQADRRSIRTSCPIRSS